MTRTILRIVKTGDPSAMGKPGIDRPRLKGPPDGHDDFRPAVPIEVGHLRHHDIPLRRSCPYAEGIPHNGNLPAPVYDPLERSVRIQVRFERWNRGTGGTGRSVNPFSPLPLQKYRTGAEGCQEGKECQKEEDGSSHHQSADIVQLCKGYGNDWKRLAWNNKIIRLFGRVHNPVSKRGLDATLLTERKS